MHKGLLHFLLHCEWWWEDSHSCLSSNQHLCFCLSTLGLFSQFQSLWLEVLLACPFYCNKLCCGSLFYHHLKRDEAIENNCSEIVYFALHSSYLYLYRGGTWPHKWSWNMHFPCNCKICTVVFFKFFLLSWDAHPWTSQLLN